MLKQSFLGILLKTNHDGGQMMGKDGKPDDVLHLMILIISQDVLGRNPGLAMKL